MRNSTKMFEANNAGKISRNNNRLSARKETSDIPEYQSNSCTYTVFREKMKIKHPDNGSED
jgi:hypothetical protein